MIGSTWSQLFPAGPVNGYPFGLIEKKDAKCVAVSNPVCLDGVMNKSVKVIGWTYNGDTYCPDCVAQSRGFVDVARKVQVIVGQFGDAQCDYCQTDATEWSE